MSNNFEKLAAMKAAGDKVIFEQIISPVFFGRLRDKYDISPKDESEASSLIKLAVELSSLEKESEEFFDDIFSPVKRAEASLDYMISKIASHISSDEDNDDNYSEGDLDSIVGSIISNPVIRNAAVASAFGRGIVQ